MNVRQLPSGTEVYGRPGGHAGVLARRAALQVAGCTVAVLGTLWALAALHVLSGALSTHVMSHGVPLVLGLGVFAVAGYGISTGRVAYAKAEVGLRSEARVAAVLNKMGAAAVLHGALIGAGGDADHIVLGPCAVAVETKTGHGEVTLSADRGLLAGGRRIPRNPLAQATRQARNLGQLAHLYVEAVVCVVDMTNPPFRAGAATVCSLADLPAVIRSAPKHMDAGRARALAATLAKRNDTEQAALDARRTAARQAG